MEEILAATINEKYAKGDWVGAVELCYGALTDQPAATRIRLLLSKLLFERGYLPFAVDELRKIAKDTPGNVVVENLILELDPNATHDIDNLGPRSAASCDFTKEDPTQTVAEAEFSLDDLSDVKRDKP